MELVHPEEYMMGKYFTWKELSIGRIPSPAEFMIVFNSVQDACCSSKQITDAALLGSSIRDIPDQRSGLGGNARSDVDVVVIYRKASLAEITTIFAPAFKRANDFNVPLNIYSFTQDEALGNNHCIGPMFASHIRKSALMGGAFIGIGNIADYFANKVLNDQHVDGHQYIAQKVKRLRAQTHLHPHMTNDEEAKYFSKLSEAPAHAIRHWLYTKDRLPENDSREEILRTFARMRPKSAETLNRFFALDKKYTAFVEDIHDRGLCTEHGLQFDMYRNKFETLKWEVPEFLATLLD